VQDWRGFELFIAGATHGRLAICPQSDRSYRHRAKSISLRFKLFSELFGSDAAYLLTFVPHMNAGIFAMQPDAPHWARWAEHWRQNLKQDSKWFGSGQAILTHMIYNEDMPAELLPGICNWQCHLALPLWDEEARCFVEPHLPHQKILLMHMTDDTKWLPQSYGTLQGNRLQDAQLNYGFYRRLCDGTVRPLPPEADAAGKQPA
jgi:hypothetical protein